jgi:hypothetical protein
MAVPIAPPSTHIGIGYASCVNLNSRPIPTPELQRVLLDRFGKRSVIALQQTEVLADHWVRHELLRPRRLALTARQGSYTRNSHHHEVVQHVEWQGPFPGAGCYPHLRSSPE